MFSTIFIDVKHISNLSEYEIVCSRTTCDYKADAQILIAPNTIFQVDISFTKSYSNRTKTIINPDTFTIHR